MSASLLPPNASPLERALVATAAARLAQLDPSVITRLRDPATCPVELLPWLAWAHAVDEWSDDWPEETRRAVIAASIAVHRSRGTVASVRRVIVAFGVRPEDIEIHERLDGYSWECYGITLGTPITVALAQTIKRALDSVAPARCRLVWIRARVALVHDGTITHDGSYTHGTIEFES